MLFTCSQVKTKFDELGIQFILTCFEIIFFRYPDIKKFIVQDLPATRKAAESYIASKGIVDHRVEFEEQDFFKPQQRRGKYVFVMQRGALVGFIMILFPGCLFGLGWYTVLHNWNNEDCKCFCLIICHPISTCFH